MFRLAEPRISVTIAIVEPQQVDDAIYIRFFKETNIGIMRRYLLCSKFLYGIIQFTASALSSGDNDSVRAL